MKSHWRDVLLLLPLTLQQKIFRKHFSNEHREWIRQGRPLPPSHLTKQEHLKRWARNNQLQVLVETGTYLGDMVFAMQDEFRQIISIELAEIFYQKAVKRFRNNPNIKLYHGDSGIVLEKVMQELREPALIWLDGHYSAGLTAKGEKECPVYEELEHIFASPYPHTVLIDDARLFVGKNDYPSLAELKDFVKTKKPGYSFSVDNDAIIITPNS